MSCLADLLVKESAAIPDQDSGIAADILKISNEVLALELLVSNLTDEIATAKKALKTRLQIDLPEMLEEIGTELWASTEYGIKIEIADTYTGSFPKKPAQIEIACDEIKRLEREDILTVELTCKYARGKSRKGFGKS